HTSADALELSCVSREVDALCNDVQAISMDILRGTSRTCCDDGGNYRGRIGLDRRIWRPGRHSGGERRRGRRISGPTVAAKASAPGGSAENQGLLVKRSSSSDRRDPRKPPCRSRDLETSGR